MHMDWFTKNSFNPLNPSENLLHQDDDSSSNSQFRLNFRLSGGMTYVLVMTTSLFKETGVFSITTFGVDKLILQQLSEYI